ncbi:DUF4012 domain-containing protein [Reticulibacter mediterranei]|nr:DUF4012 domain-containing protein [Reticulibacter mediterranei]
MDIHSSTTEPAASLINDLLAASAFVDEPSAMSSNVELAETMHAEEITETTASEQVSSTPPAQDITELEKDTTNTIISEPAEAVQTEEQAVKADESKLQTSPDSPAARPHAISPKRTWIRRHKATTPIAAIPSRKAWWRQHLPSLLVLSLLFFVSVLPLSISVSYEAGAYTTYQALRSHASTGMQHLLNVKQIFAGAHINSTSVLDPNKLTQANKELAAARQDFVQVQTQLDNAPSIQLVKQYLPQYRSQIRTARAASQIGIDLADIGHSVINSTLTLEPRFRSPLLAVGQSPLITSSDIDLIGTTIDNIIPHLDDIQRQLPAVSLNDLPISTQTRHQLQQIIPLLPQVKSSLVEARTLLEPAQWLLGVNEPRTFLVQTMDRGELRPTGGFTGQYGELQIYDGRVAPFSLHDIALLEYGNHSPVIGHFAPSAYRSWWPFANWGLRDSNLSADFPTSAKIAMAQYKDEVKHDVDGVILLSPFLIQHILHVIGPIQIPSYNETITAENLEERLHYYQLDNAGIRRSEIIEHVEDPASARKLFTAAVTHTLMDRVRHAPLNELMAIGMQLLHDLKTKDLQVYVDNQQIEELLQRYGYSGEIDRSTTHDGLYIVQTNVSASKASQYVQTKLQDTVTLDAQGGATHVLQMRLIYNQLGTVYGLDTYRDYVRIYVPPSAKFLWGNGFDSGQPLCGGPLPACPANGVYPHQELVCPTGQYQAGYAAPMLDDPYAGGEHPLDKIGKPTTFKSDEDQRGMFGGYVVIPKNCTMTVTLSWYVPPMDTHPYSLLVQRQSGTYPDLTLTVQPYPGDCATQNTSLYFNGVLTEDTSFALKNASVNHANPSDCALRT